MTELQTFANGRPPKIEVAILHPKVIATVGIFFDGEGRSFWLIENLNAFYLYLNGSRKYFIIFGKALSNRAGEKLSPNLALA